jgi:hypothetical protein
MATYPPVLQSWRNENHVNIIQLCPDQYEGWATHALSQIGQALLVRISVCATDCQLMSLSRGTHSLWEPREVRRSKVPRRPLELEATGSRSGGVQPQYGHRLDKAVQADKHTCYCMIYHHSVDMPSQYCAAAATGRRPLCHSIGAVLVACYLIAGAAGHGYMYDPPSRNVVAQRAGTFYDQQSGNGLASPTGPSTYLQVYAMRVTICSFGTK